MCSNFGNEHSSQRCLSEGGSYFNKKKNPRQSTTDRNLLLPMSYFPTLPSFFLTSLELPLYKRYQVITLKKYQKMFQYTQKLLCGLWLFDPKSTKDTLSLLGKNKINNKTKPAIATKLMSFLI